MKADLFLAPVHTSGLGALAHRTAAGFVVLASSDAGELVELLTAQQNEPDVIDQLVARVSTSRPEAFALLFTAGGDLFFLAWGAAQAQITSVSTQLVMSAARDQVLVHPVSAGINESAARIRLFVVDPGAKATPAIDLRRGHHRGRLARGPDRRPRTHGGSNRPHGRTGRPPGRTGRPDGRTGRAADPAAPADAPTSAGTARRAAG